MREWTAIVSGVFRMSCLLSENETRNHTSLYHQINGWAAKCPEKYFHDLTVISLLKKYFVKRIRVFNYFIVRFLMIEICLLTPEQKNFILHIIHCIRNTNVHVNSGCAYI